MTMESQVNGSHKQSLLEKFGLSLDKLDSNHIEKCSDVKELEQILRVLR